MKDAVIVIVLVVAIFAVAVGIGLAVKGCSDDETQVSTIPSSQELEAQYGEDVQALKDAVTQFQNAETYASVDSISNAFTDVENSYDAALESGRKVKDARISSLNDAYDNLKLSIDNIDSDKSLSRKIQDVKDALNTFVDELKQI